MLFMILSLVSGILLVLVSFLLASPSWQNLHPVRVEDEVEISTRSRS
jgi:hypothetical protein